MSNVESEKMLRKVIKGYDNLSDNMKLWLDRVSNRLERNEQDFRTYLALSRSNKDMDFFDNLKLISDMSYYVVAPKREYLEKFRIYYQVYGPKNVNDLIFFSNKVFLNTYVRQTNETNFNIDEMVVSNRRLQVYCHANNNMTDKQSAWIQGNLFASDICDRIIKGNRVLILSEYKVDEIEALLQSIRLKKIAINDNDLQFHGLYNLSGVNITDKNISLTGEVQY